MSILYFKYVVMSHMEVPYYMWWGIHDDFVNVRSLYNPDFFL
jgi:hypothetical protein